VNGFRLDPAAQARVSYAVRTGTAVRDPSEAAAAVALARHAQRRLSERLLPSALWISGAVTAVWLLLVALPVTLNSGPHPAALGAGVGIGVLLLAAILALGRRQLRLARRAELANRRLLDGAPPP
jgi:peptidoglycan/LPS O-acetylase OafA/YrhL